MKNKITSGLRPEQLDAKMGMLDLLHNDADKRVALKKLVRIPPRTWEQTNALGFYEGPNRTRARAAG